MYSPSLPYLYADRIVQVKFPQNTSKKHKKWFVHKNFHECSTCHMLQKSKESLMIGAMEVPFYRGGGVRWELKITRMYGIQASGVSFRIQLGK